MSAPYNVLRSKLTRAVTAYLISVGAGSASDTTPERSTGENPYPNTTVRADASRPEIQMTGIRRIMLHISIKGSASQVPDEPNPDVARLAFDARCGVTYDALMQTDDGQTLNATCALITAAGRAMATAVDATPTAIQFAANNADMADFTLQALYDMGEGDGSADANGCDWEEILLFEAVCSPSAL